MKRIAVLVLLAVLTAGWWMPLKAQGTTVSKSAGQSEKSAQRQQKALYQYQKKQEKAQQKAQRRSDKQQRKAAKKYDKEQRRLLKTSNRPVKQTP
jgi:F0F1-type ATP synthase membrane subunit b/b'